MDAVLDRRIADMDGPDTLPRRNGELIFDAAWEGRVFGLAVAMHGDGRFEWDEFRDRLIEEIAAAERQDAPGGYYARWLASFERLLDEKGLVPREELEARVEDFEAGRRDDVF